MTTRTVPVVRSKPGLAPLLAAGGRAAIVAVVVNLILFFVGRTTGAISGTIEVVPGMGPLEWGPVVMLSVLPPLGAAVLLFALARFLARPLPAFFALAAVVYVAFAIGPFNVVGASAAQFVLMQLMHVVVAVPVLLWLPRALRSA